VRRILLAVLSCLVLALTCVAQQSPSDQPATQADVERLFQSMHTREMMDKMITAMAGPMHQMMHEEYLKNQDKLPPDFETHMTAILDGMMKDMPWDEMMQAMIPAYQKHFTKGDVDTVSAFYASPTGQKMLREMPAITAESMSGMMPIMQKYMDQIKNRIANETTAMLRNAQKESGKAPAAVKN